MLQMQLKAMRHKHSSASVEGKPALQKREKMDDVAGPLLLEERPFVSKSIDARIHIEGGWKSRTIYLKQRGCYQRAAWRADRAISP
jgi:hypothetical protein